MFRFVPFRKPCSGYKLKEVSGSIFTANGGYGASQSDAANPSNRTTVRVYKVFILPGYECLGQSIP